MKIALVTMPIVNEQCDKNFAYMETQIHKAIKDGADLIVFPQNAISGYLLGDTWLDHDFCSYVDSFNEKIIAYSDEIAIVWGNIKYRNRRRFNAAFYAYKQQTHMRVKKNKDDFVYQDHRYFMENDINSAIDYEDHVMALNFGNEQQIADVNINIDARPFFIDDDFEIKGTTIYANNTGISSIGKNVILYAGASKIVKNHKVIYQAKPFEEAYAIVDLESEKEVSIEKPTLLDALCMGIQTFDEQSFHKKVKWIVGMSGGLDSSITAALLVCALGKERVLGFNMATNYNCQKTIDNAQQEAKRLGIQYKDGNIEKLVSASVDVLQDYGYDESEWNSLVKENIQARIRGHLLASFAQINGGVIVNNANKVELALGYCTLYGDAVGALSIIGDLTKVQLFSLSKEINECFKDEIIPLNLLPEVRTDQINWEMPPSAELKDEQLDPMKWFYHDYLLSHLNKEFTLTQFMRSYLDKSIFKTEIGSWLSYYGLDEPKEFIKDLDWFMGLLKKNGFKRLQTPPFITLTKNTFGNALVETSASYDQPLYEELKEAILHLN